MRSRRAPLSYFAATTGVFAVGTAILFACSSSDTTEPVPVEAGMDAPAPRRDAPPADDSATDDAASTCTPRALTGPLKWHPPKPFNPSACDASQIEGFIKSCIHASRAVCDAFRQQNPTCAACVYSTADEATWGAIVDNLDIQYSQLNQGGCIYNAAGEVDETGCGGAFELYDECRNVACLGCFPIKDTKKLPACQGDKQVATICAAPIAQGAVKCPKGGTAQTAKCFFDDPLFENNVRTYTTLWCSTPADGGTDAGDGGD